NIGPGDDWNEKMLQDARHTRIFIPVVSPSWSTSEACRKELDAFLQTAPPEHLFPVIHIPVDNLPPEIRKTAYLKFYKEEDELPPDRQPRQRALRKLAKAIVARLDPTPGIQSRIAPQILEKCGWMRILNMTQRIDAGEIYTEVYLLERSA